MTRFLPLLFLLLSGIGFAQTSVTYYSSTGHVSTYNAVTGYLDLGGSFVSPNGMGGGCSYGSCPAWPFTNYPLSYVLPDGSTANFTNFTGTANFTVQSDVRVQGVASGTDSTGAPVSISVNWAWSVFCQRGCTKHYLGGSLTVSK